MVQIRNYGDNRSNTVGANFVRPSVKIFTKREMIKPNVRVNPKVVIPSVVEGSLPLAAILTSQQILTDALRARLPRRYAPRKTTRDITIHLFILFLIQQKPCGRATAGRPYRVTSAFSVCALNVKISTHVLNAEC